MSKHFVGGFRNQGETPCLPVSLSLLLESSSVSSIDISTLLRCCSLTRFRFRPRLPPESTLPESFSSRLALRVCACEDRDPRKPPVLRFFMFALCSSFDEVAEIEDEMATAVDDDDEEELNLVVELVDEDPEPALPLCSVELLEVLAVLLAEAEAEADTFA